MQAVSDQLMEKAIRLGVDVRLNTSVSGVTSLKDGFQVETKSGLSVHSRSVICATEGRFAEKLLSNIKGLESIRELEHHTQRSVGSMYYTFTGETPVKDAILILNGEGCEHSNGLVNTVSFPHIVNEAYAPKNCGLCSVSIPSKHMIAYEGREEALDQAVRKRLSEWFPDYSEDIQKKWKLERTFHIKHAQPSQLTGPVPANVHGGRDCSTLRGLSLPEGLFVCGDYMATATLNGAIETGLNAAKAASFSLS